MFLHLHACVCNLYVGTVWTASAHVITAVIGSGVLSLAWSIAQMGWVIGPIVLLLFGVVTYFMSMMLADCYRHPDPVTGKRNYTYMDAVKANLGSTQAIPKLVSWSSVILPSSLHLIFKSVEARSKG